MAFARRVVACYLLLVSLAVAGYFVVHPLYAGRGDAGAADDVWAVLNWFMAVAAVLLVLAAFSSRSALAADASEADRLVAGGRCYVALALLLGFCSNWFADAWGGEVSPVPFLWVVVDITLPLLAAETALALWREREPA